MKKKILEYRFTILQKMMLLIVVGLFWLTIQSLITGVITSHPMVNAFVFITGYAVLVVLAFSKRGFVVVDGQLFKAQFFVRIVISKSQIDMSKYPKLSVLKFRKTRKLPWFSVAQPDASVDFNSFEINILNEKHTQRNVLMDLKNKKNVNPTIDFLTSNTGLTFENYNPKTRRTPRRR